MELSKRLSMVARAVTPGNRVADVGTDHGYVPIYLVERGVCPKAMAMDINRGPLQRAKEHIAENGLSHSIGTRLSNGLENLSPEETDTVVIAGMGGDLICRILAAAPGFLEAGKELILQPQSEWFKVRHFLHEAGYRIEKEWFLKEDGKYYVVIKAILGKNFQDNQEKELSYQNELYYEYGACLIEEKHPILKEYLEKECAKKRRIALQMEKDFLLKERKNAIRNREKRKERMEELKKQAEKIELLMEQMS